MPMASHSFWYVQTPDGSQLEISAIHYPSGQLNAQVLPILGYDRISNDSVPDSATHWSTGLSSGACEGVTRLVTAALLYRNGIHPYPTVPLTEGNSNSFARWLGSVAGFSVTAPPGSMGWGTQTSPKAATPHVWRP